MPLNLKLPIWQKGKIKVRRNPKIRNSNPDLNYHYIAFLFSNSFSSHTQNSLFFYVYRTCKLGGSLKMRW